jgi:hypothetical protein
MFTQAKIDRLSGGAFVVAENAVFHDMSYLQGRGMKKKKISTQTRISI